jgi:histone H1/5
LNQSDSVIAAITALKERGGSSRQAIKKYVVSKASTAKDYLINATLTRLLASKKIVHGKTSGKFKVGEKDAAPKKAKAAAKKPAAEGEKVSNDT